MENVNKTNENEEIILHLLKTKYYDMTVIGAFEKLVEDLKSVYEAELNSALEKMQNDKEILNKSILDIISQSE